jgi:predicted nucleic-acid-binding protein
LISLDTNVLARFYVDDSADHEATQQRAKAAKLMASGAPLFVTVSVILELVWVVRAHYEFSNDEVAAVLEHLSGVRHVTIERSDDVQQAIDWMRRGLNFADALHLACSAGCEQFATFDDQGFARKATKLGASPLVQVLR